MTFGLIAAVTAVLAGEPEAKISPAVADGSGFLVHAVESPRQGGPTKLRVLRAEGVRPRLVVYVLPVEAGDERRYGDGLAEIRRLKLHERFDALFVAPTFDKLPWYADHPTDPKIRQEAYFVRDVVPFVDRTYFGGTPEERLLLGFSKSGWGAFSLVLRRPETFARAVAWDTPLLMNRPGLYGSGPIFGTEANFESYRLTRLFETRGRDLGAKPRLILVGRGNFDEQHRGARARLVESKVPHVYIEGAFREHRWEGGWLTEAVEALLPPQARRQEVIPSRSPRSERP